MKYEQTKSSTWFCLFIFHSTGISLKNIKKIKISNIKKILSSKKYQLQI